MSGVEGAGGEVPLLVVAGVEAKREAAEVRLLAGLEGPAGDHRRGEVAQEARRRGAIVLAEESGADPLNDAVRQGLEWVAEQGDGPTVVVPADLAYLSASVLDSALAALAELEKGHVPDLEGSGTTLIDRNGHGHTGTLTGPTWTTAGRNGGGLSFDGVNDSVRIGDHAELDLTTGMTLEAWVFPTSLTGTRTVIAKERSGGFVYALFASNGSSLPSTSIRIGTTIFSATGSSSLYFE